ncbi:MAG TPA: hypothetical protein VGD42_03640 [Lysobacter sp.]
MNNSHDNELPEALRWQLRALRRDEAPAHELWPGIAARLQAVQAPHPVRRRWLVPTAIAASLLLVVGVLGRFETSVPSPATESGATLVQREADGMTRQYQAALQELAPADVPTTLQPTFDDLDRNAALIRDALVRDPDSKLLLEQLRRTYARRLALAQRVAYT